MPPAVFWDVEAAFHHVNGVVSTTAGYTGGTLREPTYEQVSSGTTGHVEAVRVIFNPAEITYDQLLEIFWSLHTQAQTAPEGSASGYRGGRSSFTIPRSKGKGRIIPAKSDGLRDIRGYGGNNCNRPGNSILPGRRISPAVL